MRREVVKHSLGRIMQRSLASSFQQWRSMAAEKAHFREVVRHSLTRIMQRSLASSFQQWQAMAAQKARFKEVVKHSLSRIMQRSLASSFQQWQAMAAERARFKEVVKHSLGRIMQRSLASSFQQWQAMAAEKARFKEVVRHSLGRIMQRSLASSFQQWHSVAAEKARLLAAQQQVAAAYRRCGPPARCLFAGNGEAKMMHAEVTAVIAKCLDSTLQHLVDGSLPMQRLFRHCCSRPDVSVQLRLQAGCIGHHGQGLSTQPQSGGAPAARGTVTDVQLTRRAALTSLLLEWRDVWWKRSMLRATLAKLQHGAATRALQQWRSLVIHKAALKARLQPVLAQWRNVRLRAGFNGFLLQVRLLQLCHHLGKACSLSTATANQIQIHRTFNVARDCISDPKPCLCLTWQL